MPHTLESQSQQHNNNYTHLEALYRAATGNELVLDPYRSAFNTGPELTLSASVVIPAWNARDTLEQCLIAIEQSTFNRKYQQQLEVVVVDDGSTDGTWELLRELRLNVRLKAVRQAHHSRAHTQNTGIAVAEGGVIICCDADMILTPFSIEEMVRRHQVLDRVMLIGFRGDVQRDDPSIQPDVLREHLPRFLPPFERDVRLNYGVGWPESMCRDTNHLKQLGEGKCLITCDGIRWTLANMVYGALFSLARRDFMAMDGYDERFYGWGCEDTLVGMRALALEKYIIPVYSAAGLHIAHGDRSPRKWQEFAANRRVFQAILRAPFTPDVQQWLVYANRRVSEHFERTPSGRVENDASLKDVFTEALKDASRRGKYLYALGRFDEATAAFASVRGTAEQEAWALFDQGKTLRVAGRSESALSLLEEAARRLPESVWPLLELALVRAMQGDFARAFTYLEEVRKLDPANNWVRFLYQGRHVQRAEVHAQQGDYLLAARDYEAALMLDADNVGMRTGYATALAAAGRSMQAQRVLAACDGKTARNDRRYIVACMKLADLYLARQEFGAAKHVLELARRYNPHDQEVMKLMATIHTAVAQAHPLPLPRDIIKRIQAIPGWLWEDEPELLIGLTLKTVARCDGDAPVLVEIGSYCGRATVAMGLAARSLGRNNVRIISVDEPSIGPAPGGGSARDVLRSQLAEYGLAEMVIYAPEDDSTPWLRSSQFVLVDGRHDYASIIEDVVKYAPRIGPAGYLVFHDYADYCPDVQRFVNELLQDEACPFEFVAHTGTLITFARRAETSDEQLEQYFMKRAPPVPAIWMYWEGPMPAYIALCCKTVFTHNEHVVLLNRTSFEDLFLHDRDTDIDALCVEHRSDFIRAYLLKYYGGLCLDADTVVVRSLASILEMARQSGFVGYRVQQGYISNGLMASTVGGDVISEAELLGADYFLSFLFRRALKAEEVCSLGGTMQIPVTSARRGIVLTLPVLRLMITIEGWLTEDEADLLIAATWKAVTELPPQHAVVEIGSYCGRSTVVLASIVKAACAQTKVYAIDPHTGIVGSQDRGLHNTMPTREKFMQNVANAGLSEVVELIPNYSFEVLWERPICLLLIDGLHDYINVSRDFHHFEPWMAPGAYIAFHDYADYYPGVKLFVNELLSSGYYQKIHHSMSMIVVQKADDDVQK